MNKKENGFSLVIVVIFMSIAALFVGYLMGSWLIGFLVEDDSSQMAEEEVSQNSAAQIAQSNQTAQENQNSEEVTETENNQTAPTSENEDTPAQTESTADTAAETAPAAENTESPQPRPEAAQTESPESDEADSSDIAGSFGVQIGAFSNYNNALNVQETVEELGYDVVITDSSPHQVQVVGYQTREEAESAAADLESEGYNGFIVIRE